MIARFWSRMSLENTPVGKVTRGWGLPILAKLIYLCGIIHFWAGSRSARVHFPYSERIRGGRPESTRQHFLVAPARFHLRGWTTAVDP